MAQAIAAAASVRCLTSPNPWVGAVVVEAGATQGVSGATQPPGGAHAEIVALSRCSNPRGATLFTTLEPCSHRGRTGPCADALIDAGVARVVIAIVDPDPLVAGRGIEKLRQAGIEVVVGVGADAVSEQLAPYLHHRRTGRPWVVLKMAATLDGMTAAADGTSQWISGPSARADVHRLRAESNAILVGAGTVAGDNPSLTVRDWAPELLRAPTTGAGASPDGDGPVDAADLPGSVVADVDLNPRRIVLGHAGPEARVHPCLEWDGSVPDLLDHLGQDQVVQLMVEGGATVAASFRELDLVDEYVIYLAPALAGGSEGRPLFTGAGPASITDLWRGRFADVATVGDDIRVRLLRADAPTVHP